MKTRTVWSVEAIDLLQNRAKLRWRSYLRSCFDPGTLHWFCRRVMQRLSAPHDLYRAIPVQQKPVPIFFQGLNSEPVNHFTSILDSDINGLRILRSEEHT